MSSLFRWFPLLLVLLSIITLAGSAPLPHHNDLSALELRDEGLSLLTERSLGDLWEREFDDEYLFERDILPLQDTPVVRRNIFQKIKEGFQKFGNAVKSGFQKVGQGIKNVAQKVGNGIKTAAQKVGQGVKTAVKKVGEGVKKAAGAVKNVAQKVGNGIKTAAKKVGEGVKKAAGAVKNVAQKVGNGIKNVAKKVGQGVKTAAQKVGQGIKTAAQKVGQGVKTAAQKVGKFVKENGAKVAKFGLQVWSTAQSVAAKGFKFIPGIGKPFSAALEGASKLTGLAADKIPADLGPQLGKGFDVMNKIKNPIGGAAGAVMGALRREELEEIFERYSDLEDLDIRDLVDEIFEERHFDDLELDTRDVESLVEREFDESDEIVARDIEEEDVLLVRDDVDEIDARYLIDEVEAFSERDSEVDE